MQLVSTAAQMMVLSQTLVFLVLLCLLSLCLLSLCLLSHCLLSPFVLPGDSRSAQNTMVANTMVANTMVANTANTMLDNSGSNEHPKPKLKVEKTKNKTKKAATATGHQGKMAANEGKHFSGNAAADKQATGGSGERRYDGDAAYTQKEFMKYYGDSEGTLR